MTFANNTPFAALDIPLLDARGRSTVVAVIKVTYTIRPDRRLAFAEVPHPIRVNDEMWFPDRAESSIRLPTDACAEKRGTDVIVVGDAISRRPVTALDVCVRVRDVDVPLRVHGPRVFFRGVVGVAIGPAAPFERQPILYENAYGGVADEGWTVEPRNRAGVGVAKQKADLVDRPAPQIEHPARPHRAAGDAHPPVGYGAIALHWSPRLERSGTFDEVWRTTRMPLPPLDFDVRANNAAHPSLLFEQPLSPGDAIAIGGMHEDGPVAFEVPRIPIVVCAKSDISGRVEVRPSVDTVVVLPNERVVEMTMRAAFAQGRGRDVLREVRVDAEASG
ncbi:MULTISPECIES: DUF2169 family type VI secretion system accessory protein [Sorangium]|uniref:DUF2169 domain-containing protein n=1 Tax=Sorangium cellulosum (strain So ce56) TaxID=448385 RepID=A9EVY8_SORC5|nr:DUF2169 domain-containing protein [Sorangium cellulosum]CAN94270.1 hypothetical protein sce4107 [Sorangium cellulosum So ce56]